MSDDWNNNQQHDYHQNDQYQPHQDQQPHNQYQGDQQNFQPHNDFQQHTNFQPQPDFQPQPEHQYVEPAHEAVVQAPSPELVRLDAVEAAIHDLRAHIDEMKASLHAQAAAKVEPEPEAEPVVAAADPHADRLAAIEAEIGSIKTLVGAISHNMADLHSDVKANGALHDETRGIVDEQHQLMRGLNYIITSAIGTLTTSAKTK